MTVSVKLGRIFAVSRVLGVENLKPMVVSLKLGVLAMLKAEGLSHRQNPPVSMNTTIGFQVFIPPEHVNTANFRPNLTEYRLKKKYESVSFETLIKSFFDLLLAMNSAFILT